jgi:ABC-type glycerol-3-phosphate transport system permease component
MTQLDARTTDDAVKTANKLSRKARRRKWLGWAGIYLILGIFAIAMIFPFVYMFFTSLKDSSDVFTYPPRVLPYEAKTVDVSGEPLPLFTIETDEGDERSMVLVEPGVKAGAFALPSDLETTIAVPLEFASDTGKTMEVDGEPLPIYTVTFQGATQDLVLLRGTAVGRFIDPDDPTVEGYAVVRTAESSEQVTARWSNYEEVLGIRNFGGAIANTVLITILVVAGTLFTSIMGGYAFARMKFPGRDQLFVGYLGSIMIPFVVLIIPLFQIVVALDWNNTLAALVWPFIYTAYGTFLMRQFFLAIPKDLEEAAFIDGASRWRILWTIFVPLSWPAVATLATFQFLYAWNSFIWPLVVIDSGNTDSFVLTLALSILGGQGADQPQLVFAGVAMAVVIPLLVFAMAQRYFVENVASSGIK